VTAKTAGVIVHNGETPAHHGDTTAKPASVIEQALLVHAARAPRPRSGDHG
jgi:hypothetical protein